MRYVRLLSYVLPFVIALSEGRSNAHNKALCDQKILLTSLVYASVRFSGKVL